MESIILGDGRMGHAIAAALADLGVPARAVLGRPVGGRHEPGEFGGAEIVFEASRGEVVPGNVAAAIAGGCRRLVIATTGWDEARPAVDAVLRQEGASAVASPNFSLGVGLFLRLVDEAVRLFGLLPAFDPYVLEWHRRSKADRPSGTAKELSRRILAAHPLKRRLADPGRAGPPSPDELELSVVRAGASPGMHLVGFDAAGESIELRVTARDRSAYAAGAIEAARWLLAEPREPGLHPFDAVMADLVGEIPTAVPLSA